MGVISKICLHKIILKRSNIFDVIIDGMFHCMEEYFRVRSYAQKSCLGTLESQVAVKYLLIDFCQSRRFYHCHLQTKIKEFLLEVI